MDWILAALALFNITSMITIHRDRNRNRIVPPWSLFAYSLITSELAWLWLPTQISLALLLWMMGATSSPLGNIAMIALAISWIPLAKSVRQAFAAEQLTETALRRALGNNYQSTLPENVQLKLENHSSFDDWCRPFHMSRPDVEVLKNIPYGPGGIRQELDIYRPKHLPTEGCPVLLQIHGGAWMMGSKDHQALPLMHYMASKGWICVAINYRLSPSVGFPTHLEDCKRALTWIRNQGSAYGMNPDFVAVTGGSAGGHLTALMGLTENRTDLQPHSPNTDTSVQAVVPFYGVYDFLGRADNTNKELFVKFANRRVLHQSPEENPELWELASPISHLKRDLPPFMIVQGEIDSLTTVNGARHFHHELQKVSKQPTVYLELPGAEHAFDNIHSPRTDPVAKGVHRFLEWTLAQHRATQVQSDPESTEKNNTEEAADAELAG